MKEKRSLAFGDGQLDALREISAATRVPVAELIREGIDLIIARRRAMIEAGDPYGIQAKASEDRVDEV